MCRKGSENTTPLVHKVGHIALQAQQRPRALALGPLGAPEYESRLNSRSSLGCLCRPFPAGFTNLGGGRQPRSIGLSTWKIQTFWVIRAKRPLRAPLSCSGVPPGPSMKGAMLGAAFWHELPKMSGFVHVDSPRGQSNGPRLATTT